MIEGILIAHGVGRVYQSPLPLWLYLLGAAVTVLLSFALRSLTAGREAQPKMLAGPDAVKRTAAVLRVLGLALLGLIALFAFLDPDAGFTIAPLLFWVVLIVGTVLASCVVAGFWGRGDAWSAIESFYRDPDEPRVARQATSAWIGPAGIYALFWFELVSQRGFDPAAVLVVLAAYTVLTLFLRGALGEGWADSDPLGILFGFAERCAPIEASDEGLRYRGFLSGLDEPRPMSWPLFTSALILLASTTLDNLRETTEWTQLLTALGVEHLDAKVLDSAALLLLTLPFLVTFVFAVAVSLRWLEAVSLWEAVRRFAWSLIPIGIAYVLAHNLPLVMIGLPELLDRILDAFGLDLFARYIPSPLLVWVLALVVVVGGHVLGVLTAHRTATRMTDSHGAAVRSHVALTVLMSLYTISTLWLLSLPLVTER